MTTTNPGTVASEQAVQRLLEEFERAAKSSEMAARIAASRVHVPIGQTPRRQIWTLGKIRLFHYFPQVPAEQRKRVPLLLVFALINRPEIFDLRPGNSFVEYMLRQGYEVYLLDWGRPGLEDAQNDFGTYATEFLPRAIRAMQRHSGEREFSLLGWCIGATICTIYAAQRPDEGLRNLLLLTAPLDFSNKESGAFSRWLNTEYYNVDELVRQFGNVPAPVIEYGNKMLKPVENYIGTYLKLWDNLDNPKVVEAWMAMHSWVSDNVDFPGAAFRQWVVEFYRENRLMEGKLIADGRPVRLENITCNFLNVIADKDHIVPTCQSTAVMDKIGSKDKLLLEMRGGHIGMMVGSGASKRVWPQLEAWLARRSD
jgi:polyhydroxyalkanoate synthase